MSHAIHSGLRTTAEARPARRVAARLRSGLRALLRELAGTWRHAAARREFDRLDERALRDLGMSRCEFDSYWAETQGLAEQTRVRVTRHVRGSGL